MDGLSLKATARQSCAMELMSTPAEHTADGANLAPYMIISQNSGTPI